ncbi:MAG: ABC transporter permease [Verrucomicrobiae bacterium]|nr:ABC transporter permease [Verrucomicrobiae bacterium]NNJ87456.1 ABC transporter permease [Akkermansiaceae bacterium]
MAAGAEQQGGASGSARDEDQGTIQPKQILDAEEKYGYDVGVMHAYLRWLGLVPKEIMRSKAEFAKGEDKTKVLLAGTTHQVEVTKSGEIIWPEGVEIPNKDQWRARVITVVEIKERWQRRTRTQSNPDGLDFPEKSVQPQAVIYQPRLRGLLQGDLQRSMKYNDRIWDMMKARFPISLFYGILSMIIIYSVCLPLGILKAIKHRSFLDTFSSILVFSGYAIPGYVLGAFLLLIFGFQLDLLPQMGFVSANFESLSFGGKVIDLMRHAIMPLACYLVGSFAFMTLMMKNNLMDNLAADYVRTATAKGVPYRVAVFKHAFRNSLIPIATTFGQNITLIIGGSFLIEKIFDINGFGLMQFTAVLDRDETVILGVLVVAATLQLIGNILSDICVALVDPRISYK